MMSGLVAQSIPFVHPAMAGAAVALGLIPILVHLLSRRRFVRVPWAAMAFLLAAHRRSARRLRFEQSLLLLARVLVIVLLGLAVARPYVSATGPSPWRTSSVHRVLLLDNSLSMSAEGPEGGTRFELAKRYARALLDAFPSSDAVSLVTLAAPAQAIVAQPAYDRRFLRDRLRTLEPTQRSTDTVGAIDRTIEILRLSEAPPGNRAVYLISDLPRNVWHGDPKGTDAAGATAAVRALRRLMSHLADPAVDLHVARAAPDASPTASVGVHNVAVTTLGAESALTPGRPGISVPVSVVAEVTNVGESTAQGLTLQIHRDEQIVRREPLPPLAPGRTAVTTVTTTFPTAGTHLVEARLTAAVKDALEQDNARFLSLELKESMPALLVDGRPGATSLKGEAGFLALALSPTSVPPDADFRRGAGGTRGWGGIDALRFRESHGRALVRPKAIAAPQVAEEPLEEYDIIALCNVPLLTADDWRRIEIFVSQGKGLLIFGGDLVDVENYNRFAYAGGSGLLPGTFEAPPAHEKEGDRPAALALRLTDVPHPLVSEFAGRPDSSLFSARIDRYLPLKLEPSPADRGEIVLQYTNGDPALVASTFGSGRVLTCTTTANMGWTNLPAKGDFVPLMMRSAGYLAPAYGERRNIVVGDFVREPLAPQETSYPLRLSALSADGRRSTIEPALSVESDPDSAGLALNHGPIEGAGPVRVSVGPREVVFAVNVDRAESDLASMTPDELRGALDGKVNVSDVSEALLRRLAQASGGVAGSKARTTELGVLFVYVVFALLLLESWMAQSFSEAKGA